MKRTIIIFCFITFFICILLAIYTDHRWEDWYITFRASKNLALGNGFVYNKGEYLMTYTSPLGALIPAFIKFIFLNYSDELTIWLYRIFCSAVLSIVPFFIIKLFNHLQVDSKIILFSLLMFVFNFLIIDNTINGMESSLMVFFVSYLLFILITIPDKTVFHLTLCFAGLMYTRPDGFIYGGALILSFLIFNKSIAGFSRLEFVKMLIKPILISIIIFSPWFFWTWFYYGTPIPHTIIAKSRVFDLITLFSYVKHFLLYYRGAVYIFMPQYSGSGWSFLSIIAQIISLITSLYWINFRGGIFVRIISFSTFLILVYLNAVSGQGPLPWYLPPITLLSIIVLGLIFQDLISLIKSKTIFFNKSVKFIGYVSASFLLFFCIVTFLYGALQMKYQQKIIEFGNRKEIGLWLKKNNKKNDTVFMECLGYFGFYSEMKTLDFPGMSSTEVVSARKFLNTNHYSDLIANLKPNWLVLRPNEIDNINNDSPNLLKNRYLLVKVFDVTDEVYKSPVKYGKPYLLIDAKFSIYKYK